MGIYKILISIYNPNAKSKSLVRQYIIFNHLKDIFYFIFYI